MTDHSFSDPLAGAFARLTEALENRAAAEGSADALAALTSQLEALEAENAELKTALSAVETREAEIRARLDAAIAQVDVALVEE